MVEWSAADVRGLRLRSQLLGGGHPARDPVEVARWFGAMQAQEVASGLWSLGARVPGATAADVSAWFESGALLRTWPMRGTLHIVAAEDARWLLDTAGSRMLRGLDQRWLRLGLDESSVRTAVDALAAALSGGRSLSRSAALEVVRRAGVDTAGQRGYHLLWYAAQTAVTCVGPQVDGEQTFRLLAEWAPQQRDLSGDPALARLALLFFRARGPALMSDFQGWSGLTAVMAKRGVAECGDTLVAGTFADRPMWAARRAVESGPVPPVDRARVRVLPGFDEFVLGYKERSLIAEPDGLAALIPGNNGVFRATVMVDGRAVATWRRTLTAARVDVQVLPFAGFALDAPELAAAFEPYGVFLGREVRISVL